MILQKKQIILFFLLFFISCYTVFSQSKTTKDNYTGAWETPSAWNPEWPVPLTVISGSIAPVITINGYITVENSLLFNGSSSNLIINDTLIIKGDLSIGNNNDLSINDNGILIVWGNLNISNQSKIISNGYLIVVGNVYKSGTSYHGSWISNDNPVKVFVGGTLPVLLTENVPNYQAVSCTSPASTPYTNTRCSYGNMTDLAGDPIYGLLQKNCSATNVSTTLQVCIGGAINLTSSYGTTYAWSGPSGFTSSLQNPSLPSAGPAMAGDYKITITNGMCTDTDIINVIVNPIAGTPTITPGGPITFCEGDSVTLTSSDGLSYLWSTGETTQKIIVTSAGSYTVRVSTSSGCLSVVSAVTEVYVNATPSAVAGSNSPVCSGNIINLNSSGGITYSWKGPDSYESDLQSPSIANAGPAMAGSYAVTVTAENGCTDTMTTIVVVNDNPVADPGPDQELTFISETEMKADLSSSETGEWSILSGAGHFSDIHSPVSGVTELSIGENIFLWKVRNGNCEDTASVKITVYDPFVPSVITPDNDGKNDYFVIGAIIDKVELIIFNRWGNEEYSNSNYLNDWDGRNNEGRELPNDTYFYVLKFGNIKIKQGSVLIKR